MNVAEDLMKQKRSFASFRFRPKSIPGYELKILSLNLIQSIDLESYVMINRAYDLMNNINVLVNDQTGEGIIYDAELEVSIYILIN